MIVYNTHTIPTDIEHTAKPINLSGARTIKLTHRPAGVSIWISTDSNGSNLFPLINRGDGWINMPEPLYNCYVYTQGTNNQDFALLNYTGEKDFFTYGSNSIEKVGEIESLGQLAQLNINNAMKNTFNKIPYTNDDGTDTFIYNKTISGECGKFYNTLTKPAEPAIFSNNSQGKIFLLIDKIDNLKIKPNNFYRITIDGHVDLGSYITNNLDEIVGGMSAQRLHLGLYKNELVSLTKPLSEARCQHCEQLYKIANDLNVNVKNNYFDFWGLKSLNLNSATPNPSYYNKNIDSSSANVDIKFDQIVSGNFILSFDLIGFFLNCYLNIGANTQDDSGFHYSLNIQISKALTKNDISSNIFFLN